MELYYELSKEVKEVSKDIGLYLSSMEVLRMTIELKKLEEIYKPEFIKPIYSIKRLEAHLYGLIRLMLKHSNNIDFIIS